MTNEEKLRFLVAFCGQDLEQFRAGDWLNVLDDLGKFFGGVGEELTPIGRILLLPNESLDGYTEKRIRDLQQETKGMLQAFAISAQQEKLEAAKRASKETQVVSTGLFPSTKTTISWVPIQHPAIGGLLQAYGSIRDVALTSVVLLITEQPFRVMKCPECGALFFRNKKQQFCSSRCGDRLYMRLRRKNDASVRAKESDSNHRQYEKRVRRKTGGKVSIGRKRRTK